MKKLLAIIGLLVTVSLQTWPVEAKETSAATTRTRKAKAPKAPVNTGYGETRKERDQRLLRECRGKPNAGACEGYAS